MKSGLNIAWTLARVPSPLFQLRGHITQIFGIERTTGKYYGILNFYQEKEWISLSRLGRQF